MGKIQSQQLAFQTQLHEPELVLRSIGFTTFVSTWLIRQVDPKKAHPNPVVEWVVACPASLQINQQCRAIFSFRLPLPKEVPMAFRALPEYIIEDVVEYLIFAVQSVSRLLQCVFADDRSQICTRKLRIIGKN
jgi:ubiquitin conjugation factor E4 B